MSGTPPLGERAPRVPLKDQPRARLLLSLLWVDGWTKEEAGEMLGVSGAAVHQWMEQRGLPMPPAGENVRRVDREAVLREVGGGAPYAEIAERHGCQHNHVSRIATAAGLGRKRRQSHASETVKKEAVARVKAGEPVAQVADSIGYGVGAIYKWIKAAKDGS